MKIIVGINFSHWNKKMQFVLSKKKTFRFASQINRDNGTEGKLNSEISSLKRKENEREKRNRIYIEKKKRRQRDAKWFPCFQA